MNAVKRVEIKNRHFSYFARLINILDFDPKKLDIQIKGNDDIGIYYIQYDSKPLLTYLKYEKVWEEIKNSINYFATDKFSDYNKDYRVIMFM